MKSAAIISKPSKPELASILPDLFGWFRRHGYHLYLDQETAGYTTDHAEVVSRKEVGDKRPDFVLVLGGDYFAVGGTRRGPRRCSYSCRESWLARLSH